MLKNSNLSRGYKPSGFLVKYLVTSNSTQNSNLRKMHAQKFKQSNDFLVKKCSDFLTLKANLRKVYKLKNSNLSRSYDLVTS